jgi:polyhydroxybutyrate depolymerase
LLHWGRLIGCKSSSTGNIINKVSIPTDATTMEVTDYLGCPAGKKMSFLKLNGGGHAWPSGLNQPKWLVGNTSQEIDEAAFVWQFVKDVSK